MDIGRKIFRVHNDQQIIRYRASITLEASLVLPIFIFAIVSLLFLMKAVNAHLDVQTALSQGIQKASVRATLDERLGSLSIYKEYVDLSSIKNKGFIFPNSKSQMEYDYSYSSRFDLLSNPFFIKKIGINNRLISKIWNGDNDDNGDSQEEYVYITKNGTVYHNNINCTYLKRSTRAVDISQIDKERNMGNARYYPCEICARKKITSGLVYITSYGTAYHRLSNCPMLVRDIKRVPISKVGNRGKCSKCYQ